MKFLRLVFVLLLSGLVSPSLLASSAQSNPCSIKPGKYLGWDSQTVTNRWVTLTFVPQLGGRLMQVEFNGHAYLFSNPRFRGQYISPAEAKGDWINYGGDKVWPMPEGNQDEHHWVIQSTAIDDLPYRFETISQGERCTVRLTGQPDTITGMRIVRTVTLGADSPEIRFHAVMENATRHPITWSIQSVSQYDLADPAHSEDFNHNFWAYTARSATSLFPDGYHVRYGLAEDPAFSTNDDLFRLHWSYFGNEVWLDSTAGWLTIVDKTSGYGMVEHFSFVKSAEYPGKTTVIFYKNGPHVQFDKKGIASIGEASPETTPYYMEAEINSPIVTLVPGESYAFDTTWHPIAIASEPKLVSDPGIVTSTLSAMSQAGRITLRGDFSVFFPGRLVAIVYNRGGAEIGRNELTAVDPAQPVQLNTSLPAAPRAHRIALKLLSDSGEDWGTLASAIVETNDAVK